MSSAFLYGMIVSSTVLHLRQPFPQADGYAEVGQRFRMVSGETANAAIVLARLGVSCVVQGNWPGEENAELIQGVLAGFGIDTRLLKTQPDYPGMDELVVSDGSTRTVFASYKELLFEGPRRWDAADERALAQADVCLIDPQFKELSLGAARRARALGKKVVGIDCTADSEMLELCDVVAVSEESLGWLHPGQAFEALAPQYLARARGLVAFTFGPKPMIYGRKGQGLKSLPAFEVQTKDTLGAGDTFKAGLGYSLLQGFGDEQSLRFAAACAALNCQRVPGVLHSPSLAEVESFLSDKGC
jgi:sugar/nucleoside kinase (ribokinase family)